MPVLLSEENKWLTVVDLEPVYCSYRLYMFECRNRNLQASKMAGMYVLAYSNLSVSTQNRTGQYEFSCLFAFYLGSVTPLKKKEEKKDVQ